MESKFKKMLDASLLELAEAYPGIKEVLDRYNLQAGECILCYSLFETLGDVIKKYGLDEKKLLNEVVALVKRPD